MAEPFIGEIRIVSFNFPPRTWAFCNGQLLPINQNQALFSLLGTNYGGNGQTTFALPDLRARVPVGAGQGPGLADRTIGERSGAGSVTLTLGDIPSHSHRINVAAASDSPSPSNRLPGPHKGHHIYGPDTGGNLAAGTVGATGGSQPHTNVQPFLGLSYTIALQGIFPSQQ